MDALSGLGGMSGLGGGLAAGFAAGLGIAVPLGAMGVLLIQQAMQHGARPAVAAAAGMASVDAVYAWTATLAGTRATQVLTPHARAIAVVSGLTLLAVAGTGLYRALRARPGGTSVTTPPGIAASYARFVALTAINPMTCTYFVALTLALPQVQAAPLVIGVLLGSLTWQLVLVAGGLLGRRPSQRSRLLTAWAGNGLIAAYAIKLLAGW